MDKRKNHRRKPSLRFIDCHPRRANVFAQVRVRACVAAGGFGVEFDADACEEGVDEVDVLDTPALLEAVSLVVVIVGEEEFAEVVSVVVFSHSDGAASGVDVVEVVEEVETA